MNDELYQWLRKQIDERDWSDSEFARRTDLSKSYISAMFSHQRNPTADFCLAAARALHADPAFVLGLAGLLPPTLPERRAANPLLDEVCDIVERLPKARQAAALDMLHGLARPPSSGQPRPAEPLHDRSDRPGRVNAAGGYKPPGGIPATAMEDASPRRAAPASTAETNSGSDAVEFAAPAEGAERAQEVEQMFYSLLDDLSRADNPHRQAYDALWDATETIEEKRLLARMLAAAAQRYQGAGAGGYNPSDERGGESEDES